jgi:hypothetical protein
MALNIRFPELKWVVLASFGYVMLIEIIEGEVKDSVVDNNNYVVSDKSQGNEGKVTNPKAAKYDSRTDGASNYGPRIKRNRISEDEVDSKEVVAKSRKNHKVKTAEENLLVRKDLQNKIEKIKPNSRTAGSVQPEKTSKAISKSVATKRIDKSVSLAGKKTK